MQVKLYIQCVFLPPPSPALANIQSILASESPFVYFTPESTVTLISQCARLYHVPRTHHVGLPTQFRCNIGPASLTIAGQHIGKKSPAVWACLGVHYLDIPRTPYCAREEKRSQ